MSQGAIAANYHRVLEQISAAAQSVGRDPNTIRLVVVTKGHPAEAVGEALEAGVRLLGENYAEEGAAKQQALAEAMPEQAAAAEWHMIGHVQSRKARLVCESFHAVHSLDSLSLARKLDRAAQALHKQLPVLLECNVSGEETKFGFPAWDENRWEALLPDLEAITGLPGLRVSGLMTMAPFFDTAEPARPYFCRLRKLSDTMRRWLPQAGWSELSMGMSGDFEVAVQEGATLVRVGTAIMGARPPR